MTDRQRLEAIVAVVCRYLPPDGISREEAMSQIIALVDPLPLHSDAVEPPDYVEPVTYDYHEGWEAGFKAGVEAKAKERK